MVFYKKMPTYNPQMKIGTPNHTRGKAVGKDNDSILDNRNYNDFKIVEANTDGMKYPTSVLEFSRIHPSLTIHPTQKPLDLCRYLIRTYSNQGDLVLDCCCGSGTTLLAAKLEKRNYIGMDNGICESRKSEFDGMYWTDIARKRITEFKED